MESAAAKAEELQRRIRETEQTLQQLRSQLQDLEASQALQTEQQSVHHEPSTTNGDQTTAWNWPLAQDEYTRYGRQLILPTVGIKGQLRLKASSVLLIGAGGLGCPAAAYLAGAGVGTLGIVDGDTVEASNLHRQIAHSTLRIGQHKVHSLVAYCRDLNPLVNYKPYAEHLAPQNAADLVAGYDIVLDCTDHPTSRYLISDICVLLGKPLVSASALRTDGQLIVLNNPPAPQGAAAGTGGPCYRCVFPKPPPADSAVSCGEGGILGPVVGVMGVLQALEAIKLVAAGINSDSNTRNNNNDNDNIDPADSTSDRKTPLPPAAPAATTAPSLLLFSANSGTSPSSFRSIRMRARRPDCFACSAASTLTVDALRSGSLDYVQFCGVAAPVSILGPSERVSASEYRRIVLDSQDSCPPGHPAAASGHRDEGNEKQQQQQHHQDGASLPKRQHLLLDVREKEHFDIASIPGAINIPFSKFQAEMGRHRQRARGNGKDNKNSNNSGSGKGEGGGREVKTSDDPSLPSWLLPLLPPRSQLSLPSSSSSSSPSAGDAGHQHHQTHTTNSNPDPSSSSSGGGGEVPIYVICRLGNDSQLVARALKDELGLGGVVNEDDKHDVGDDKDDSAKSRVVASSSTRFVGDIAGGMAAWKRDVDPNMPFT